MGPWDSYGIRILRGIEGLPQLRAILRAKKGPISQKP